MPFQRAGSDDLPDVARRAFRARSPWLLALLAFVAVLLVTLLLWRPMQAAAQHEARAEFEARAQEVSAAIEARGGAAALLLREAAWPIKLQPAADHIGKRAG